MSQKRRCKAASRPRNATCPAVSRANSAALRQVGQRAARSDRGSFGDIQLIGLCAYASMRDPSTLTAADHRHRGNRHARTVRRRFWTQTLRILDPAMHRAYSALELQGNIMVAAFKDFGPTRRGNQSAATSTTFRRLPRIRGPVDDVPTPPRATTTAGSRPMPRPTTAFRSAACDPAPIRPAIDMHVTRPVRPGASPGHLLNWNRLQLPAEVQARTLATTQLPRREHQRRRHPALPGALRRQQLAGRQQQQSEPGPEPALRQRPADPGLVRRRRCAARTRSSGTSSFLSWCDAADSIPTSATARPRRPTPPSTSSTKTARHYILSTDESGGGLDGEWTGIRASALSAA